MVIFLTLSMVVIPLFYQYYQRTQVRQQFEQLQQALFTARATALAARRHVTVCASKSGEQCDGEWSEGVLVFVDSSRTRRVTSKAAIIQQHFFKHALANIYWKGFTGYDSLQFAPDGTTASENGTFTYCPQKLAIFPAYAMVVNKSGRVRVEPLSLPPKEG